MTDPGSSSEITPPSIPHQNSFLHDLFIEALQRNHVSERLQRLSEQSPFFFSLFNKFGIYLLIPLVPFVFLWLPIFAGTVGLSVLGCVFAEIGFFALSGFAAVTHIFMAVFTSVILGLVSIGIKKVIGAVKWVFGIPIRLVHKAISIIYSPLSIATIHEENKHCHAHWKEMPDGAVTHQESHILENTTQKQEQESGNIGSGDNTLNIEKGTGRRSGEFSHKPETTSDNMGDIQYSRIPRTHQSCGNAHLQSSATKRTNAKKRKMSRASKHRNTDLNMENLSQPESDLSASTEDSSMPSETPFMSNDTSKAREHSDRGHRSYHDQSSGHRAYGYPETPLYGDDRRRDSYDSFRHSPYNSRQRRDLQEEDSLEDIYGIMFHTLNYVCDYVHNLMTLALFLFFIWALTNNNSQYERY